MIETIHFLNLFLPFLYFITFFVYLYDFVKDKSKFNNAKRIFLFVTLVLHTFYLLARTIEFNHTPITNVFEIFTLLACAISFSYFLLELLTDVRGTGTFIILFSLIFQIISSIFIQDLIEVREVLRNRFLGMHVISALLGYSSFTIAAVYGLLFMVLYKEIKMSKFGLIFKRLPSLETLEKLNFYALLIGFVMLSFAILIGIIWLPSAFPKFSYADPKLISSGIVWIVFAIGIFSKLVAGWYGKKVIIFSLIGFLITILSTVLSNFIVASFHAFY